MRALLHRTRTREPSSIPSRPFLLMPMPRWRRLREFSIVISRTEKFFLRGLSPILKFRPTSRRLTYFLWLSSLGKLKSWCKTTSNGSSYTRDSSSWLMTNFQPLRWIFKKLCRMPESFWTLSNRIELMNSMI